VFSQVATVGNAARDRVRSHPHLTDGAIAIGIFAAGTAIGLFLNKEPRLPITTSSVAVAVVVCASLVGRRRWPVAVVAIVTAGMVGALLAEINNDAVALALGVAMYSVATYRDRSTAWRTGALAAVALLPTVGSQVDGTMGLARLWLWIVTATAYGDALRNRRAYIAAVEGRARRAEQSREDEARRRVAEERLRIARELHDVVAHHIALIRVQAGVATHLLPDQPDGAVEALGHIRQASRTVLGELSTLVSVLRDSDEPMSTHPVPGLDQLPSLVSGFVSGGMAVRLATSGQSRQLAAVADLAAYRIVQESLTNAHKHAPGATTRVVLIYHTRELRIEVHNDAPTTTGPRRRMRLAGARPSSGNAASSLGMIDGGAGASARGGHGITGMCERATALGGQLRAEPDPDGGFLVVASLPIAAAGEHDETGSAQSGQKKTRTTRPGQDVPGQDVPGQDETRHDETRHDGRGPDGSAWLAGAAGAIHAGSAVRPKGSAGGTGLRSQ
jgi:signal transduction histidine kinase